MLAQLPESNSIPTGMVQSAGSIQAGNAVLFLMSPRDIIDHTKRSLTYAFDNAVAESIVKNMVDKPSSMSINAVLQSTPEIHTAVVPAGSNCFDIATSAYSNNWTFVLIYDDDNGQRNSLLSSAYSGSGLSNKLLVRTIVMGICATEPISHAGMMSMTPEQFLDHNCMLIITKKLEVNKFQTMGPNGYIDKMTTAVDDNIIHYNPNIWGDREAFYTLSPGEVQGISTTDEYNHITTVVGTDDSINVAGMSKVQSLLESPRKHMREILGSFETGIANLTFNDRIGNFSDGLDRSDIPGVNFASYTKSALADNQRYNERKGMGIQDITNIPLSLGMVMSTYHPKLFPLNVPKRVNAEIMSQHDNNVNNIFSSLVCAVLPTYLNQLGLSSIAFMYNSYQDAFQVMHLEPAIHIPEYELQMKWESFAFLLKNELFPTLMGRAGHFDLQAMCSVNSTTNVILNFLDWNPLPLGAIYQENAILGGIVSPLIGNTDQLKFNAEQLNSLIQTVGSYVSANHHSMY